MFRFLARWAVTALSLAAAVQVIDDIWFRGPTAGQDEFREKLLPLLGVALISCAVTAFVKPVLKFLSFPFILVTLGLFLIVLNALLLMFTGWLAGLADLGFHVEGFWPAVGGAIIISVTTWILDAVFGLNDDEDRRRRRPRRED